MVQIGRKLRSVAWEGAEAVTFECPGCKESHLVTVRRTTSVGPTWVWNGDGDAPTFSPSILVTGVEDLTEDEYARVMAGEKITPRPMRCHSFVQGGRIQFLSDCTHALAGQTVDLPDLPAP